MIAVSNYSFIFLSLVVLSLSLSLGSAVVAYPIGIDWEIKVPNSSYPNIGEYARGTLWYDSEPANDITAIGWPKGNPILSITGTRTVWSATPQYPTVYHFNSTANILGLVPARDNDYLYYNATLDTVLESPTGIAGSIAFGSLLIYYHLDLPTYDPNNGIFPNYFLVYDNYYYPQSTVPDHMDSGGWLVWLDRFQPPVLDITTYNGNEYRHYQHVWNIFNGGGAFTDSGDLSDAAFYPYMPSYSGSGGTITVSSVVQCHRRRVFGGFFFHHCES